MGRRVETEERLESGENQERSCGEQGKGKAEGCKGRIIWAENSEKGDGGEGGGVILSGNPNPISNKQNKLNMIKNNPKPHTREQF